MPEAQAEDQAKAILFLPATKLRQLQDKFLCGSRNNSFLKQSPQHILNGELYEPGNTLSFSVYCKYKNITRAAKHFYISQSTLSRNIILLEKELDVVLFERKNKHLELTKAGEVFAHDCELFIKHMQNVVHNVQLAGQGSHGLSASLLRPNLFVLTNALKIFDGISSIELIVETYDFNEIVSAFNMMCITLDSPMILRFCNRRTGMVKLTG